MGKLPDLISETQFDEDNRTKMLLGEDTPKYIGEVLSECDLGACLMFCFKWLNYMYNTYYLLRVVGDLYRLKTLPLNKPHRPSAKDLRKIGSEGLQRMD